MILACPSLMCSFNRGNFGTNSSKICVGCLCVCFVYVCIGIGLVDWLEKWFIYMRNVHSNFTAADCYNHVQWLRGLCLLQLATGRFSEAGLHEWIPFVIFHARCCSALLGWFLSRHCFTLCITVEVEPRICEAVQMPILLQLQKLLWKGDGG